LTTTSEKEFEKIYRKEMALIEKKIDRLFVRKQPASLYEPSAYSLKTGGKRLRPLLVLFSARAAGGCFKQVYNAALSVELIHNFTLVHDDIMDNSDLRRGRETVHKKYDLSTAILTGDNLIAIAYQILLKDLDNNSKEILSTFTKGIIEVCEGQSYDKEFELRENVTIDEYMKMIYLKTAALAVMCCKLGAQIAQAGKSEINALANYGRNLGIAFQIHDDLLDIIGHQKEFGKKIGSDLVEGKKTFLFLRALEKAKGKERADLLKIIENKGIKKSEIKKYREIYEKLGVLEDARREVVEYTERAIKSLSNLPGKEGVQYLIWLANVLIGRNK
jgi:geranylgeranyl diphosphate synthase type II